MTPELKLQARKIAFDALKKTIDPGSGFRAAGAGRFADPNNKFCRDAMISIAQSLSMTPNWRVDPDRLLNPAIDSINFIHSYQSGFDLRSPLRGGLNPHEVYVKGKPSQRLLELEADNWPVVTHPDGDKSMVVYLAGDSNPLTAIGAFVTLNALQTVRGAEAARQQLKSWWPYLEASTNYDLFCADINADGLIETVPQPGDKLINQTWRDSGDAFIYGNSQIPEPPYTFFANNCFSIQRMVIMAKLTDQLGLRGASET